MVKKNKRLLYPHSDYRGEKLITNCQKPTTIS